MTSSVSRCPECSSSVVLERDLDGLGLACMGCSRRWAAPSAAQLVVARGEGHALGRMRADGAARIARSTPRRSLSAAEA